MKENNGKKGMYIVIAFLLVALVGLSIAFAALSTNLNINFGTVTQTKQTWNVGFTENNSLAGTPGGSSATGRSCGTANVTSSTATVAATELSKPGDKCVWHLVVNNTGSIDATLSTITPGKPTSVDCTISGASMVCGNITYKLATTDAGTTLLTTGGTLAKTSGTMDVYLIAEYTGTGVNTSNSDIVQTGAKFTLNYTQK